MTQEEERQNKKFKCFIKCMGLAGKKEYYPPKERIKILEIVKGILEILGRLSKEDKETYNELMKGTSFKKCKECL